MELDPHRFSLRVIAESSTVDELRALVAEGGGDVVAALDDYVETDRLSGMSYNHPVWFFQRGNRHRSYFHMETGGTPLWDELSDEEQQKFVDILNSSKNGMAEAWDAEGLPGTDLLNRIVELSADYQ